jgi:type IV secretion system protein VirD4
MHFSRGSAQTCRGETMIRVFRVIGYLGFAWAAFALVCTYPALTLVALVAFAAWAAKRKPWVGTAHGTARWATLKDVMGLVRAKSGFLLGRLETGTRKPGPLLRLPTACHIAVVSPTGGGKGVSCAIPFLLDPANARDSAIVVDVKDGELFKATARQRERFGRVVVLDPFNVVTRR